MNFSTFGMFGFISSRVHFDFKNDTNESQSVVVGAKMSPHKFQKKKRWFENSC